MKYKNIETGRIREFEDGQPIPKEYEKQQEKSIPTFSGKHHNEQTKKRIGQLNREKMTGKHWYNNGTENILAYECPAGFSEGRLKLNKK
jgi:hypothetical protein